MNEITKNEFFEVGKDGVKKILTPDDKKIDIVEFDDKALCYVKSSMGYPAIYPMHETTFEPKAEAILMDLDGTSVHSEAFWMWVIEQTTARLLGNSNFKYEKEDEPFISGHSVSEHLQYMIDKYAKGESLELARRYYFEIVNHEMDEILKGRGKQDAFTPAPKPHPWLYAETARVGLGIPFERRNKVIGIEDSSAGVVSIKLAGFSCVGISGGNIEQVGVGDMCDYKINGLMEMLDIIL